MTEEKIQRPWLDNYDREVPANIDYEVIPVFEFLMRSARRTPRRNAVVFKNYRLSYAKLDRLTSVIAANLRANGLETGDRVAIMLPNLPQTILAYWAVMKAGGVVVMANPLYMETEITHLLHDSGARFMISLDLLWPKLKPLLPQAKLEKIFFTGIAEGLRFPLNLLYKVKAMREGKNPTVEYDEGRIVQFKTLLKGTRTYVHTGIDPRRDLAMLQYTGGTTGVPKGVMLTHYNLGVNIQQCQSILHSLGKQAEVFLGILPYFHIYGLTTCMTFPISLGATIIPFPMFNPRDVLKAVQKHKPTVFPSAPSIFIALMQQKDVGEFDISSIKCCVSGSAPIPVDIMRKFKEMTDAAIVEGYGLTEASPVTHLNPLVGKSKPGSIGLPFPDTDARIVDPEVGSVNLPPGKIGELIIRGPQVMAGYYGRPDETASAVRNGWLYTGDIAYMDEEGYFFIVDRKKDMIISGGYNVYPREIDEVLFQHPKIKEAVAVGIKHPTRGEVIKAYVVPKDGEKPDKNEILSFCRQKLANYKVPKQVEFRSELPKTIVGKVLRRKLRQEEEEKLQAGSRNK